MRSHNLSIVVLLLLSFSRLISQSSVLDKRITLNYSSATIAELLDIISKQSGISIQYSNDRIPVDKKVSVSCKEKALKEILEDMFFGSNIEITEYNNQVLLSFSSENKKITVSGYLYTKEGKDPLIGVNIYLPELKKGTTTNNNGFYSLIIPPNDSLIIIFSYVGYPKIQKTIFAKENLHINIEMESSVNLDEVQIVANKEEETAQAMQMNRVEIPEIPLLFPGCQKGELIVECFLSPQSNIIALKLKRTPLLNDRLLRRRIFKNYWL